MHFLLAFDYDQIEFDTKASVSLITELISYGFDIHSKVWAGTNDPWNGLTALQGIMNSPVNPCDGLWMVQSWVDLLEQYDVNIQRYLKIEIDHCTSS